MFLFKAFAALCMASFLFNTALTIFPEEKDGNPMRFLLQPLGSNGFYTSIEELSFQERTAVHLLGWNVQVLRPEIKLHLDHGKILFMFKLRTHLLYCPKFLLALRPKSPRPCSAQYL